MEGDRRGTTRSRLVSQKLGEARSRGTAANGVFINQHETGSFPAFLDAWLAGFGMRPHLSVRLRGADSAVIEANRAAYGAGVAAARLRRREAHRLASAPTSSRLGHVGPAAARLRRRARQGRDRAAVRLHRRRAARSPASTPTSGSRASPGSELAIAQMLRGQLGVAAAAAADGRRRRRRSSGSRRRSRRPATGCSPSPAATRRTPSSSPSRSPRSTRRPARCGTTIRPAEAVPGAGGVASLRRGAARSSG